MLKSAHNYRAHLITDLLYLSFVFTLVSKTLLIFNYSIISRHVNIFVVMILPVLVSLQHLDLSLMLAVGELLLLAAEKLLLLATEGLPP